MCVCIHIELGTQSRQVQSAHTDAHTLRAPSCSPLCLCNMLYSTHNQIRHGHTHGATYSSSAQTPSLAGPCLPPSSCAPVGSWWADAGWQESPGAAHGLVLPSRGWLGLPVPWWCPFYSQHGWNLLSSPWPLWWVLPGLLTRRVLLDLLWDAAKPVLSKKSLQSLGEE